MSYFRVLVVLLACSWSQKRLDATSLCRKLPQRSGRHVEAATCSAAMHAVDEHAVLTAMHAIWIREHNRLCDDINRKLWWAFWRSSDWKFEYVRKVRSR